MPRLTDALPFVVGELGGRFCGGGDAGAFLWRQYRYAGGGLLELLEPAGDPDGFLYRFVEQHGGGVHHVTFLVDDLQARCRRAEELGFRVVGYDDADPDWMEAFLHPEQAMGIVVQLASGAPGGDVAAKEVELAPTSDPVRGAPGIALAGLRLGVRDLDRARRLWCDLLDGEASDVAGTLQVRWSTSSMRIALRPAEGVEGPTAIEVECFRPALLPQGRHPVLLTAFDPIDSSLEPRGGESSRIEPERVPDDEEDTYFLEEP